MLSAFGLLIACASFIGNRPFGLYFGVAAPTASLFSFSLFDCLRWAPGDAQLPMSFIVVAVALFHVAAGYLAVRELVVENRHHRQRLPFQFSILSLLVLMLLVSVFFGLYKTFGERGAAVGALLVYVVVVAYCLRQFHVIRSRHKGDGVDKGASPFSPVAEQ